MSQSRDILFWDLVNEISTNKSPAVNNIHWKLWELLRDLYPELDRIEYNYGGDYFALYTKGSKQEYRRIYRQQQGNAQASASASVPTIANPYRGGRVSTVPSGVRERVQQYSADGSSERKIAAATGLSRKQVRYILGRK